MFSILVLVSILMTGCAAKSQIAPRETLIRVAVQKEPLVVREIPLEKYVAGVLTKEVHADWPMETLKAQAVASRTYALYRKEHPRSPKNEYDLEVTVLDQAFVEQEEYPHSIVQAVEETSGQVLNVEGTIFAAYYHSACGGISEPAEAVWPGEAPSPVNQIHPDPFCDDSPHSHWSYELIKEDEGEIQSIERTETGRVASLTFQSEKESQKLSGNALRERIGYQKIRSTLFDIQEESNRQIISGRGSGHGVGLCQWGSKGMGELGYTHQEILEFYYPGAEISPHRDGQDIMPSPLD